MSALLHRILRALVIVGLFGAAACAPAAAPPTPTAAPAKPAATAPPPTAAPAAKPTAAPAAKPTAAPAAKPTAAPAAKPTAAPAAAADWKAQWDKTVAAAKKEGKVVIAGGTGTQRRAAAAAFEKAYPDIKLEFSGMLGSAFAPKVITERDGGQFLWDIHMGGASTMNSRLKPKGVFAPLRPALILPEVLDDSKWLGGFEDSWADKEQQYVFQYLGYMNTSFYVNRDFVPESELSKLDQIVEPKWKGKIVSGDVRAPGPAGTSVGWLLLTKGEEWLRKFYAQDLAITDGRTEAEWLVRGRYPIAYGAVLADIQQFQKEGLGKNVKTLEPASEAAVRLTGGWGYITLIDKAPHPNAAKVFLNWQLSKEGQKAYVDAVNENSRRLDVEGPAETATNPKVKYRRLEREDLYPNVQRANQIAKEMIK